MYGQDASGEAKLRYGPGTYEVIRPGTHVICAVTGRRILLEDLRYWSVERQEPYASARAGLEQHEQLAE